VDSSSAGGLGDSGAFAVPPAPYHTGPWYKRLVFRDQLGMGLSILCLLHCLAPLIWTMGMLVAQFSWGHSAKMSVWESPWVHLALLVIVPTVGLFAFWPGWKRHRDRRIWYWAGFGLFGLVLGVGLELWILGADQGSAMWGIASPAFEAHGPHGHVHEVSSAQPVATTSTPLQHQLLQHQILHLLLSLPTLAGGLMLIRAHRLNMQLQHAQLGCCEFDSVDSAR